MVKAQNNLLGKANVKPSRKGAAAYIQSGDLHGGSERRAGCPGSCSSPDELLHTLLTSSAAPKHELLRCPPSSMAKGTKTWSPPCLLDTGSGDFSSALNFLSPANLANIARDLVLAVLFGRMVFR